MSFCLDFKIHNRIFENNLIKIFLKKDCININREIFQGAKMILNTGLRTDIPGFFSEWFYNRIDEGFVYVRNPYAKNQIYSYKLNPELIDCIIFCTKNPRPMIGNLDKTSGKNGQYRNIKLIS